MSITNCLWYFGPSRKVVIGRMLTTLKASLLKKKKNHSMIGWVIKCISWWCILLLNFCKSLLLIFLEPYTVAQVVKNPSSMKETWVWSMDGEDSVEKEMATHSSILAWRITWIEKPGGLQSIGSQKIGQNWVTDTNIVSAQRKCQLSSGFWC